MTPQQVIQFPIPDGLTDPQKQALTDYCLYLADTTLIAGHRLSEWCGHGPQLELDIALTNLSLDLIGQARQWYQFAAQLANNGSTEDSYAYWRDAAAFRNLIIAELDFDHWGDAVTKLTLLSGYLLPLYAQLQQSTIPALQQIATKSIKEVNYHWEWCTQWMTRLGNGTTESHQRMTKSLNKYWPYAKECLHITPYESVLLEAECIPTPESLALLFDQRMKEVLEAANLQTPATPATAILPVGKMGHHTSLLAEVLQTMQTVARQYPGASW